MVVMLDQQPTISAGDLEVASISYVNHLNSGELLTGTPTVVEVTTSDLTLGNKIVSTTAYTDKETNESVAAGQAVQFTVTTATAGLYRIRVTATTDSTPARTIVRDAMLEVV